jgi:uncharacterized protein
MIDEQPPSVDDLPLSSKVPESVGGDQPPAVAPETSLQEQRQWAMWVHLATFSSYVGVPFGNVLGPLLVWQLKKDVPGLAPHAKDAMNFHLTMSIAMAVCLVFTVFCFVGIVPLVVLGIYSTAMSLIAGLAANEGKPYTYPGSIRLIQ